MRTSLSSFSAGSVLPSSASALSGGPNTPPESETSDSFADVLQQQEGSSPKATVSQGNNSTSAQTNSTTPTTKSNAVTATGTEAPELTSETLNPSETSLTTLKSNAETVPQPAIRASAPYSTASGSSTVPSGSALSAMIIQASVQASSTSKMPLAASNSAPANTTGPQANSQASPATISPTSTSDFVDLETLFAQASTKAASTQPGTTPTASPANPAKNSAGPTNNSDTGATPAPSSSLFTSDTPDLSTAIAHALILAANTLPTAASTPTPTGTPKIQTGAAKDSNTGTNSASSSQPIASAATDLATLFAQATNLAASTLQTAASTPTPTVTPKTQTNAAKDSSTGTTSATGPQLFASGAIDLTTMLAQATNLAASTLQTTASAPTPTVTPKTQTSLVKDSSAGTTAATGPQFSTSGATDLSTLFAQATISAAANAQSSTNSGITSATATSSSALTASSIAGLGKELPLRDLSAALAGSVTKEKKSASTSGEGSFLQSGTASSSTSSGLSTAAGAAFLGINELTAAQQVTPISGSNNSSASGLTSATLSTAGIANVEKGKAMNADMTIPQLEILSGYGANTPVQQSAPDMNILLSSNSDFHDALKQVMHVAELTQTSQSLAPMRVEMEIQTPPGAIVNVYVSKQNDQWRAQLSTNDPHALAWVQDQMSSLRQSNDLGSNVRWLPPQMESGTLATSSSNGQDANLGWDRGGQGQSNYQQQDERPQSGQEQDDEAFPELATIGGNSIFSPLTAFGRAA